MHEGAADPHAGGGQGGRHQLDVNYEPTILLSCYEQSIKKHSDLLWETITFGSGIEQYAFHVKETSKKNSESFVPNFQQHSNSMQLL